MTVMCSSCGTQSYFTAGDYEMLLAAMKAAGWTMTGRHCLCPKCVKERE